MTLESRTNCTGNDLSDQAQNPDGRQNGISEQKQQRRKRRWGTANENASIGVGSSSIGSSIPTVVPVGSSGNDSRARVLALQESVKARLAAARAAAASSVSTLSALSTLATPQLESPKASCLSSSTMTASTQLSSQALHAQLPDAPSQQEQPNLKKARHYDLDLTVTAPSYKQTSVSQQALTGSSRNAIISAESLHTQQRAKTSAKAFNPYLSHRYKVSDKDGTTQGAIEASIDADPVASADVEHDANDPRLSVRAAKPRAWNKGFSFIEPGLWQERAAKIRSNQAKILESGYLSGRKKGHTVQGAAMAYYGGFSSYSSGGTGDNDVSTNDLLLNPRPDANPDNFHQTLPCIVEWWDMELLPPKLRKQVSALEKQKDDNSSLKKLVPPKFNSGSKGKGGIVEDAIAMEDGDNVEKAENDQNDSAKPIHPTNPTNLTNLTNLTMDNNMITRNGIPVNEIDDEPQNHVKADDDDDQSKIYGNGRIKVLRLQCYEQASLSYSKTAELVQHIVPIRPKIVAPNTSGNSMQRQQQQHQQHQQQKPSIVLHLTKKEMKRQRKLRRQEKQRELQDLQAAGLIPAPEPRLTLQNFFQVLGDTAVTDPSQIERAVQTQIELRQQQHYERNEANKLTKEQRSIKKAQQLIAKDTAAALSQQITVALFYVLDVSHPYHRTKIDLNAQQLNLTGGVMECTNSSGVVDTSSTNHHNNNINCVVVEGNPQSIKKFIRLMTVRMKWTGPDDNDEDDDYEYGNNGTGTEFATITKFNPTNFCELVWRGLSLKRNFHGFVFQQCDTVLQARKIFKARGVEQYWDQIMQQAIKTTWRTNTTTAKLSVPFKLCSSDNYCTSQTNDDNGTIPQDDDCDNCDNSNNSDSMDTTSDDNLQQSISG